MGRCDQPEHAVEHEAPDDDHGGDCTERLGGADQVHAGLCRGGADREQWHERNQRNGREILKQQHREGKAAVAGGQLALLLEHLQRKRGRRQCERQSREQR